jgi:hypothetical protein
MARRINADPDGYYDERVDRIASAQKECPYFEQREKVEGLNDDKMCTYDMKPCEARMHCPVGNW